MTLVEELEDFMYFWKDNTNYTDDEILVLRSAIKVAKKHSDWVCVSKELPDIGKDVCVKDKISGHYHLCELTENDKWIGQYGETYEKDEMVVWKYFEPYKENSI